MKTVFVPTNAFYREILAEKDADARRQRYIDHFVTPWKAMMDMVAGVMPGGAPSEAPPDELAGARLWGWLLPDQTDEIAALLETLESANAWERGRDALAQAAARFDPYAERIPFDYIEGWLALGDPARSNPFERGYTGATDWFQPRLIGQFWRPDEANLSRLPGLVAHEMHHLIRMKAFPFGPQTSVADYIVIEGTAEAFAASLFGEQVVGFYVTEVSPAGLEDARRLTGAALDATGFDVIRGYIFGDEVAARSGAKPVGGMPPYGGYATGYHVVRAFLERTGRSIEEATFLPAMEIVERSGYFG
jgi:uncharacterized protein YjaZ